MHPGKLGIAARNSAPPARRFFLESSSIPCFGVGLFLVCWFLEGARDCSSIPGPGGGEFWEFSLRGDDPKGISRWFPALPVQGVELMSPKGAAAPTAPPCAGAGCKSQRFQGFFPPSFLHFHAGLKFFFFFPGLFQAAVEQTSSSLAGSPALEESLVFQGEFLVDSGRYPRESFEFPPISGAFFFCLGQEQLEFPDFSPAVTSFLVHSNKNRCWQLLPRGFGGGCPSFPGDPGMEQGHRGGVTAAVPPELSPLCPGLIIDPRLFANPGGLWQPWPGLGWDLGAKLGPGGVLCVWGVVPSLCPTPSSSFLCPNSALSLSLSLRAPWHRERSQDGSGCQD